AKLLLEVAPQNVDVIIPVPLHFKKLQERKYNQSVLLGRELAKAVQIPLYVDVLKKRVPTPSQTELSQSERQKNVFNTFSVDQENKVINKHVLLLDDVYTTGATSAECEKLLLQAGAQKVSIVTLARS
ncbi:MAG: ComF family protein, partial [Deltaproteobacteria bacterium]|nr:ComF family protein [Deltaproteobacteria bacterium]